MSIPTTTTGRTRLQEVDAAKGLAIFLVVLGHLAGRNGFPPDNEWYAGLHHTIYSFHMPFFMFLSGLVLIYSYRPVLNWTEYRRYAGRRLLRLGPAFLLFGAVIILGKAVAARSLSVDRPPDNIAVDLLRLVVCPFWSSAGSLWYIQVLLLFQLLLPGCMALSRHRILPWLPVTLVLYFVPATQWLSLDKACETALFFCLGGVAATYLDYWRRWTDRLIVLSLTGFILVLFFQTKVPLHRLLPSLLSLAALYAVCARSWLSQNPLLCHWGRYTFAIYLMNTLAIGITKAVILKFTIWDGWHFWMVGPVLLLSGLTVPVLLKKFLFPKIPVLDQITS